MNFINDELNVNEECQLFPELFPIETIELFPTFNSLDILNDQIAKLTIDINTQALKIEIERTKRQKMGLSLKRAKRRITPTDRSFMEISHEVNIIKKQLGAV